MPSNTESRGGGRRTIVPSHHPMPGVDDKPIDAGKPPSPLDADPTSLIGVGKDEVNDKPGPGSEPADVIKPFWPE